MNRVFERVMLSKLFDVTLDIFLIHIRSQDCVLTRRSINYASDLFDQPGCVQLVHNIILRLYIDLLKAGSS